jgi:hypothetical protein
MMRTLPLLLLLLPQLASAASDSLAARVKAWAAGIQDAPVTVQDSLSRLITDSLQARLQQADAFTADLTSIPLTRVDAPDGSFRLFTWNLPRPDGSHRYHGLLLHHGPHGALVTQLNDATERIPSPEVPELAADKWYGALYYAAVPVKKGGRMLYTLLGWKGHDRTETRKVIEVLHFKGGRPRFGAPVFGSGRVKTQRRVFGFSFQSTMTLRYDTDLEAIVMDHLSPTRPDLKGQWAFYGPDMTHDAYFWHRGGWWLGEQVDLRAPRGALRPGRQR